MALLASGALRLVSAIQSRSAPDSSGFAPVVHIEDFGVGCSSCTQAPPEVELWSSSPFQRLGANRTWCHGAMAPA